MNILLVTPFLPYPGVRHAGGRLCLHLLQMLGRRHRVHLVSRVAPEERGHIDAVARMAVTLDMVEAPSSVAGMSFWAPWRAVFSYFRLARLARRVAMRLDIDIAQIEFSETAVFWHAPPGVSTVLTCHDVIAKPARRRAEAARGGARLLASFKAWLVRFAEGSAVRRVDRVFVLSDVDAQWARDLYPRTSLRVLRYPAGLGFSGIERRPVPGRVLFVGALNRSENQQAIQWFLDYCWATVRAAVPDAELLIVGHGAPAGLADMWAGCSGVAVVGTVDDVEPFYAEAAVCIAPILMGGGVIVKVLDAMAAGAPVVTSSRGNEGIAAPDGIALVVEDEPDGFARAVVRLLGDAETAAAIGSAGRRCVASRTEGELDDAIEATYASLGAATRA